MMQLLAWIFRKPLVWTKDFDGEVRLRIATDNHFGEYTVSGISPSLVGVLRADGTVSGKHRWFYIDYWTPANKRAERLFK